MADQPTFTPNPNFLCARCVNLAGGSCYQLRAIQDAHGLSHDADPMLTFCGRNPDASASASPNALPGIPPIIIPPITPPAPETPASQES